MDEIFQKMLKDIVKVWEDGKPERDEIHREINRSIARYEIEREKYKIMQEEFDKMFDKQKEKE